MSLVCGISNETPENPVISPISGSVFERRLAEKFITENGTDPVSGEPLRVDQLIDIKASAVAKPRPPSATSIPAVLKMMQDEWDAVMLHTYTLRQQLQTARQELSHALYQHDAACRVIARLNKEVTAAREALATLKPQAGMTDSYAAPTETSNAQQTSSGGEAIEVVGINDDVMKKLQDMASTLTGARKKRGKAAPEGLASADEIQRYNQQSSHIGLHSASNPGILCLDLCFRDTSRVATGGNDKNVAVFNKETQQVVAILKGHSKKVTSVVYHPLEDVVISGSPDETVRVWSVKDAQCSHTIRAHDSAVTGISLHATGDYLLASSADGSWSFNDIRRGRVLSKVSDESSKVPLSCCQFHPDGLIFATGTQDSQVKVWDLKDQSNVANFTGHTGPISCMAFSENGYYLATAGTDSVVKLWDLRKLKNFKTLTPGGEDSSGKYEIKSMCFDNSGTYLAVGGSDVRVFLVKQWQELRTFTDHTALATGVRFGQSAQFVATTSLDRSLKFFGA